MLCESGEYQLGIISVFFNKKSPNAWIRGVSIRAWVLLIIYLWVIEYGAIWTPTFDLFWEIFERTVIIEKIKWDTFEKSFENCLLKTLLNSRYDFFASSVTLRHQALKLFLLPLVLSWTHPMGNKISLVTKIISFSGEKFLFFIFIVKNKLSRTFCDFIGNLINKIKLLKKILSSKNSEFIFRLFGVGRG